MARLPAEIAGYLSGLHVLSLSVAAAEQLWAASCFYVFDKTDEAIYILTSPATRHGTLMRQNPRVAGTVSSQIVEVENIVGLQFTAIACQLDGHAAIRAQEIYCQRHPVARTLP